MRLEGNRRLENIVFTVSADTREDVGWGSFTAEIGVGMDVGRVLETPAVSTFCRASAGPTQEAGLPNEQYSRLKMSQVIPERDFPGASRFVACVVRCLFVRVPFASSAPAPVLRFLDPLSLFDRVPTEPKYESIGSSPDMDERGGLMEVHSQRCSERAFEIGNSKERSAHRNTRTRYRRVSMTQRLLPPWIPFDRPCNPHLYTTWIGPTS